MVFRWTLVFLLPCLTGCYTVRQAWHQNNLFNSRRPLSAVIEDPQTDENTKEKLKLTLVIRDFARRHGLNIEGAYDHFIDTGKDRVSYLVQAAHPDRLESVTWWFPFVGRVPYLGFFEKSERDAKARELADQGYDVYETGVGAFSSLGWFDDPVFSSMLKRDVEDLANLYLHELTHRTFWISGSVKFNENLAEYVADYLTPLFLKEIGQSDRMTDYRALRKDRALFKEWLERLRRDLDALYEKRDDMDREELFVAKEQIFRRYTVDHAPNFASYDFVKRRQWNNATVLGASLYEPDLQRFAQAHACLPQATIYSFLETLDAAADEIDDPFEALDSLCQKQAGQ